MVCVAVFLFLFAGDAVSFLLEAFVSRGDGYSARTRDERTWMAFVGDDDIGAHRRDYSLLRCLDFGRGVGAGRGVDRVSSGVFFDPLSAASLQRGEATSLGSVALEEGPVVDAIDHDASFGPIVGRDRAPPDGLVP